jgi:hypothetical protein
MARHAIADSSPVLVAFHDRMRLHKRFQARRLRLRPRTTRAKDELLNDRTGFQNAWSVFEPSLSHSNRSGISLMSRTNAKLTILEVAAKSLL